MANNVVTTVFICCCLGLAGQDWLMPATMAVMADTAARSGLNTAQQNGKINSSVPKRVPASDAGRLALELRERYRGLSGETRPVIDASDTMQLQFGISLIQLLDLDEKNQVLTMLLWKTHKWKDEFLAWDPAEYGGVKQTRLPVGDIWTPDIILYNNVGKRDSERHDDTKLVVYADGTIVWIPPVIYSSSCVIDVSNFPFDIQNCTLRFGSWTYSQHEMNVTFQELYGGLDLESYISNTEWEMVSTRTLQQVHRYSCCEDEFQSLIYILLLKRRPGFFTRIMLMPALLLSITVVFIFWIPAHRPDRTTLGLSLFTSFMLQLLLLVEISPPSAESNLGTFCSINVLMVVTATLLSIAMINVSCWSGPMPQRWRTVFVVVLPRFLRMHHAVDRMSMAERTKTRKEPPPAAPPSCDLSRYTNQYTNQSLIDGHKEKAKKAAQQQAPPLAARLSDWQIMVATLDRIFFFIYSVFLATCIGLFFPRP